MGIRETIAICFWFLLSIFVCIQSLRLGLGSLNAPGSGFLSFGASLVVGILAVVLFLKDRRQRKADRAPFYKGKKVQNVAFILALLFAYPLLLNQLGYFLCTLFFVACSIKVIGQKKWRTVVLISISTAIVSYLLFDVWLQIQIPRGRWVASFFNVRIPLWR
jgi:putative tricarboxylic transport membrane protein